MSSNEEDDFQTYREDKRIPCRYGAKCYQKNAVHHEKYKHPPAGKAKRGKVVKRATVGKKRKKHNDNRANDSPKKKIQKKDDEILDDESVDNALPLGEANIVERKDDGSENDKKLECNDFKERTEHFGDQITIESLLKHVKIDVENGEMSSDDTQTVISHLFLTTMPKDFFEFYEFCKSISEKDPLNALKDLHLQLVGPYDVFGEKFLSAKVENKESLLTHWRYYYDPPEFQTVVRDIGKDGLHYGYWRDDISEEPVFVARNKASVNCLIDPVAENMFGALDAHIAEKLKVTSPFEKTKIAQLQQKLKNFAKVNDITLEKKTDKMRAREKRVVARTFHKAGIVVPYNKKTQLGYRDLAVTDNELQKILQQIENPPVADARKTYMAKLEEVIRLVTIAADECDFGTALELGHDLLSCGIVHVETKALNLLSLAYTLLQRTPFLEIIQAHLKSRKQSLDLNVLQYQ